MQYEKFTQGLDWFKAVTLPQPLADEISRGEIDHFVKRKGTNIRGEILIVSKPGGERGGMVVGRVNLDSVTKCGAQYVYRVSNPERMIEFPCQKCGAKGEIWDCYYTANVLTPYPKINLRAWMHFKK